MNTDTLKKDGALRESQDTGERRELDQVDAHTHTCSLCMGPVVGFMCAECGAFALEDS